MQIHLKQHSIEEALRDYIVKKGINLQGCSVEISFVSARKPNGLTADIEIIEDALPQTEAKPVVPPKEVTEVPKVQEDSSEPLTWAYTAEDSQEPTNEEEVKDNTETVGDSSTSLFG